jgi:hypothetical protein
VSLSSLSGPVDGDLGCVMAVAPTTFWFEYLDIAGAILTERLLPVDGMVTARGPLGSGWIGTSTRWRATPSLDGTHARDNVSSNVLRLRAGLKKCAPEVGEDPFRHLR